MLRIFLNKNIWKLTTSKITRHTIFIPHQILHQKYFDESRSSTIYALSSGCFIFFFCIFCNIYIFIKLILQLYNFIQLCNIYVILI